MNMFLIDQYIKLFSLHNLKTGKNLFFFLFEPFLLRIHRDGWRFGCHAGSFRVIFQYLYLLLLYQIINKKGKI